VKSAVRHQALYRRLKKIFLVEFLEALLAAVVVALFLRTFIVGFYRVPTESMMPTLLPGDFIVAFKTSYGVPLPFSNERLGARVPDRGDVVVFQLSDDDAMFIKRVVGVPGDRVEIRNGALFINEVSTSIPTSPRDDWLFEDETTGTSTHRVMRRKSSEEPDFLAPIVVPPGQVFLLGDLRSDSFDSRHWGPIPISRIHARASFVAFSLQIEGRDDSAGVPQNAALGPELAPSTRTRLGRTFKIIE
jgi:signal peptidase I